MIDYEQLSATQAQQLLPQLCDVLQACVADGGSIGFIDATDRDVIARFWQDRIDSLARGNCDLLVARQQGVVVATVMVNNSGMPNGRHRAEISKLLVLPLARRQGIARQLMQQAELRAQAQGKPCWFWIRAAVMLPASSIARLAGRWQVRSRFMPNQPKVFSRPPP